MREQEYEIQSETVRQILAEAEREHGHNFRMQVEHEFCRYLNEGNETLKQGTVNRIAMSLVVAELQYVEEVAVHGSASC